MNLKFRKKKCRLNWQQWSEYYMFNLLAEISATFYFYDEHSKQTLKLTVSKFC